VAGTEHAARGESGEAQAGEEERHRPQFARPYTTERSVGTFRQQWKNVERHYGEPCAGPQTDIVDALHQYVQLFLFDEQQRAALRHGPTTDAPHQRRHRRAPRSGVQ